MKLDSKFLRLVGWTLVWRIALFFVAIAAPFFFDFKPSFLGSDVLAMIQLPQWVVAWTNFDGVYYFMLVTYGYRTIGLTQAFFPVFPLTLAPMWQITHNTAAVVILAQTISFFSLLVLLRLYEAVIAFYVRAKPIRYVWLTVLILLFPTSFYLAAVYTESLFLALVLGSFVAASHRKWLLAGILAGIASGTRVVGIMLVPALLIELGSQTGLWRYQLLMSAKLLGEWVRTNFRSIIAIFLGITGLVCYSAYLWYHYQDPLYFFHVQSEFGAGRQESLILFPQVVWRYLKIFATSPFDIRYLSYVQEFVSAVGGLLILLLGRKLVRPSLLFFSIAVVIIPTLTGTFSSMSRYILVAPAIFLILNAWLTLTPRLRVFWLVISTLLLILNTMLFIQGYWVA